MFLVSDMKRKTKKEDVMKLIKYLPVVMLLIASVASAGDQPKFGFINFNQALNEVSEGKKAKEQLQKEFNEKQKTLEKAQVDLKKMKEKLEKDKLLLSADAFAKNEEAYRQKFMEMQQMLITFKQEMATREATVTQEILERLRNIIRDIGKKEDYAMILESSQDVVIYAPTSEDITDRVIKAFNKGEGKSKKR